MDDGVRVVRSESDGQGEQYGQHHAGGTHERSPATCRGCEGSGQLRPGRSGKSIRPIADAQGRGKPASKRVVRSREPGRVDDARCTRIATTRLNGRRTS